jgi:hypothetical protein
VFVDIFQKGESLSDVVCRGEAVKANQELATELKALLAVSEELFVSFTL